MEEVPTVPLLSRRFLIKEENKIMKQRLIQTRFWDDESVVELSRNSRYLFIYLITSQYINICGIFQLHIKKISFETALDIKQIIKSTKELEDKKKAYYRNGWWYVLNAYKNNNYTNSIRNVVACIRELKKVPFSTMASFKQIHTGIYTDMYTDLNQKQNQYRKQKMLKGEVKQESLEEIESLEKLNPVSNLDKIPFDYPKEEDEKDS